MQQIEILHKALEEAANNKLGAFRLELATDLQGLLQEKARSLGMEAFCAIPVTSDEAAIFVERCYEHMHDACMSHITQTLLRAAELQNNDH